MTRNQTNYHEQCINKYKYFKIKINKYNGGDMGNLMNHVSSMR
jgi:hypothetical protein